MLSNLHSSMFLSSRMSFGGISGSTKSMDLGPDGIGVDSFRNQAIQYRIVTGMSSTTITRVNDGPYGFMLRISMWIGGTIWQEFNEGVLIPL